MHLIDTAIRLYCIGWGGLIDLNDNNLQDKDIDNRIIAYRYSKAVWELPQ